MTSTKNVANPVGGKTARACDSCMTKRARWYCAADDAFLCQACDSSVHSANSLARRHERLRLKTASYKSSHELNRAPPSWHHGFTKKARTPRHGKQYSSSATPARNNNPFHLVPEVCSDDVNSHEENEEQLLYRVPIFEPFERTELCMSPPSSATSAELGAVVAVATVPEAENKGYNNYGVESLHGFAPSEIELAEFAADVESLLGRGLENECIGMEELGLVDTKEEESRECSVGSVGKVKMEEEESPEVVAASTASKNKMMEMEGETFELNFDYDSHETSEEVKEKVGLELDIGKDVENGGELVKENEQGKRNQKLLQLDYEAVISAWASQKCPWTTGDKPNLDPDQCWWPHCMVFCFFSVS